jgi:hypothetical protein
MTLRQFVELHWSINFLSKQIETRNYLVGFSNLFSLSYTAFILLDLLNLRGHTLFQAYSCVGYDRPGLYESSRRCEPQKVCDPYEHLPRSRHLKYQQRARYVRRLSSSKSPIDVIVVPEPQQGKFELEKLASPPATIGR